jgi:DNA-directed RNA polymerase-4/5 subunit 2
MSRPRENQLSHQLEIKRDEKHEEAHIFYDTRRILRPLLVVENLIKIKRT